MSRRPHANNGAMPEQSTGAGNWVPSLFQGPHRPEHNAEGLGARPSGPLKPGSDLLEKAASNPSETEAQPHSCDLCSAMISECQPHCTDGNAELCEQCFKQFQALPQGKIRECLERFMLGNVV